MLLDNNDNNIVLEDRQLVSVIVPVYNIQGILRHFRKAVQSVLLQSYNRLELLLINDGSTDNTETILNDFGKKDSRIRVFHKSNGGVESARRYGLSVCKGDFVMHMDQDDLMHKRAIEKHYTMITNNNADITIAESKRFIWNKHIAKSIKYFTKSVDISNHDFMEKYYIGFFGKNLFPVNIWNKMYRKSFLESIYEPPCTGQINEDLMYNMHVFPSAKKIIFMEDVLYYYRWGGFTSRYDKTLLDTAKSCYSIKMEQIERLKLSDKYIISTSIEYLNYLNSFFYQEVMYNDCSKERFCILANRIMNQSDVKTAVNMVHEFSKYRNGHIDAMLNNDFDELYKIECKRLKKNKHKLFFKRLFLK